jgi:hypothetical protein
MSDKRPLRIAPCIGLAALGWTPAYAADLPIAEPVEYVRICDAFGAGFYYIPGTDTCLRISGRVRVETHYVERDDEDEPVAEFNNWTSRARGYLRLDARTQTDLGLIRSYINVKMTLGPSDFGDAYSDSTDLEHAFIQISNDLGMFTAGVQDSFFDAPFASNTFGVRVGIDDPTTSNTTRGTLFGYTGTVGDFSASVSIEDPASNDRRDSGALDDYEGQEWPDLVANVRYTAGWGQLFAAAALRHIHDKEGFPGVPGDPTTANDCDGDGIPDPQPGPDDQECGDDADGFGWAINAGGIVEFGIFSAGLTAGYADGAIRYVTLDPGGVGDFSGPSGDDTNQAWSVRGGIGIEVTPTLNSFIDASFTTVDDDAGDGDYDYWAIAADLQWTPVSGLMMGPEIAYSSLEFDDGDGDVEEWGVMFRIQRDF